jgi:hypothetical protein
MWSEENRASIHEAVTGMYSAGIVMAQGLAGVMNPEYFQFSLVDTRAIAQLDSMGLIFASTSTGTQIITPVATRLARQALEQGLGLKDASMLFREGLRNIIPLRSDIYYSRLASVVIGRARNFSRILAFDRLHYSYVEVVAVGDERTCPNCSIMNGTVYRVKDLVDVIDRVLEASTPEDLVNTAPFINGIDLETSEFNLANGSRISTTASSTEMASAGLLPLYHPECRCTVLTYEI